MTELVLVLSVLANFVLLWYIYRLLSRQFNWSEDLDEMFTVLNDYHFHIKTISEMESFYGDELILNLLRHSKAVVNEVEEFNKAYSLTSVLEEDDDNEEETDGEEEGEKEEDDTSEEKTSIKRKAILHSGS